MTAHTTDDGAVAISGAAPSDLPEVLALLAEVGLPSEGVRELFTTFLVARDGAGRLVGCAGIERHDASALLRSVAVSPGLQRSGLGSRLTEAALDLARATGARDIVLLTTTAREFFVSRFAFTEARRADYDACFAASPEWELPRCSSAAVLRLGLER